MRKSKPSATACLIAGSLYWAKHDPRFSKWVSTEALRYAPHALAAYGAPASWFSLRLDSKFLYHVTRKLEKVLMPGIVLHYMLRKQFIEDSLRKALDQGLERVLVIGGGFDTLLVRLHAAYPQVDFIELDHPATQRAKRAALSSAHFDLHANLSFLPIDLTDHTAWVEQLADKKKTLFIAEGVFMYFPEDHVRRLLTNLAAGSGPQSQLLFTSMAPLADGRIDFKNPSTWVRKWMRWRQEPFTWGISLSEMSDFLKPLGWRLQECADSSALRKRYLAPAGLVDESLVEGESLVVCERV